VDLICDVSGDPNPIIRWTKVGSEFEDNVEPRGNVLKVSGVRSENGGVYRCIVTTESAVYEEDYALTIQCNFFSLLPLVLCRQFDHWCLIYLYTFLFSESRSCAKFCTARNPCSTIWNHCHYGLPDRSRWAY